MECQVDMPGNTVAAMFQTFEYVVLNSLSYDVASESEITPCNKIDKPLFLHKYLCA